MAPLTMIDIMNDLNLQSQLVSMSACETGVAHISGGDEVVGLIRAVLYAGTPSVLASLWSVDDIATSVLMEQFYSNLRTGHDKSESLRQAQQFVREITAGEVARILESIQAQCANNLERALLQCDIERMRDINPDRKVYRHPYYWAAFMLVGDCSGLEHAISSPDVRDQTFHRPTSI